VEALTLGLTIGRLIAKRPIIPDSSPREAYRILRSFNTTLSYPQFAVWDL